MPQFFIDSPSAKCITLAVRRVLCDTSLGIMPPSRTKVAIAFSGGPDSTALALACLRLRVPFILAHLDHGLRLESAKEASGHIQAMAKMFGVEAVVRRSDVHVLAENNGMGLEEAGRKARYAFFADVCTQYECSWILLGHQADDLVEDVIMRLIRGAGWPSVAGMSLKDDKRRILRPLLYVCRRDIEDFIRDCEVPCLYDYTNDEDTFLRNRVRHHIVPFLRSENPSIHENIRHLWEQANDDRLFWDEYLASTLASVQWNEDKTTATISEKSIRVLPRSARMRAFAKILQAFPTCHLLADTLYALDSALMAPQRPKLFQFQGKISVRLEHGLICFAFG